MNERPVTERLKAVAETVRSYYGVSEQEFYYVGCRTQEATEARYAAALVMLRKEPNATCPQIGKVLRVAWPKNLIYKARRNPSAVQMAESFA